VLSAIHKGTVLKVCVRMFRRRCCETLTLLLFGESRRSILQSVVGMMNNHELKDKDVVQVITKTNSQQRQSKNN
jgi:hypothetical protein